MGFLYNIYFFISEFYSVLSICYLIIFGIFFSTYFKYGYPLVFKNLCFLVLQVLIFDLILSFWQIPFFAFAWNNLLSVDYFTYFSRIFIYLISIFWIFLSLDFSIFSKTNIFEYWILILINIIATLTVVHSYDLLSMYLAIEFQSLIFYILASLNRTSEFSIEAGLKYFIFGAFSSAFLLFGSVILYNLTGLTNFIDFSKLFSGIFLEDLSFHYNIIVGFTCIIISFLFKLGAAPFHFWIPDVYEGVPLTTTAFFALLPKIGILGLLIKFLVFSFSDFILTWNNFLIFSCFLSSLIGTFGAFTQTKWKRFIAYSSISHISFFLLALIVGDLDGISNLFIYLFIYSITTVLLFSIITNLRVLRYPFYNQLRYLQDINSLHHNSIFLSISLFIAMFSMAGIPPLAGFFSKFFIFLAALKTNIFGLTLFLVITSCLSSFYYIRFSKLMFFSSCKIHFVMYPMNKFNSIIIPLCLIFLILFFLDIEFIFILTKLMMLPFTK